MKLAMRQEKFLNNLKNALIRIENRSYSVCRVTGKLISKERLKLVPHATLSIEAKKCNNFLLRKILFIAFLVVLSDQILKI